MHPFLFMALSAHAEPTETAAPPAGAAEMHRALSARDGAPPCEDIEALSEAPVEALLYIVDNATQPPWAGVRAAECLTQRHAAEAQPHIERWVQGADTRGFALVAFNNISAMPVEVALPIARAAINGPLAADARPRLEKVDNDEIQALLK